VGSLHILEELCCVSLALLPDGLGLADDLLLVIEHLCRGKGGKWGKFGEG
jgi:hypothetical protein